MNKINTFFLRIAAVCNLDCDYCYVFKHNDFSWKNLPPIMNFETLTLFIKRLKEYVQATHLKEVNIIFHGGEPLLVGEKKFLLYVETIKSEISPIASVLFSLQTNATLFTTEVLEICKQYDISVSVSLDGFKAIHDKHRFYKVGLGSFEDVVKAIKLLQSQPSIFSGVIGVIDPSFSPEELLAFYDSLGVEKLDLLLPDANYLTPPKGRADNADLYKKWIISAFDNWFNFHQSIQLRTFESILQAIIGLQMTNDTFGFGELDYLTIETDGTFHSTDILKVTYENASFLNMDVFTHSISEALASEKIIEYNRLLSVESLPSKCKKCDVNYLCGAGSLPHRYSKKNGFENPTIYCEELYALITHITKTVHLAVQSEEKNATKSNNYST